MNLCVSDSLTCVFAPFFHTKIMTCQYLLFDYLIVWSTFASLASILSISIDRFLLVAFPIRHRVLVTGKVVIMWLAAVWISSFVLPIAMLFYGLNPYYRFFKYAFCKIIIILWIVIYVFTYYKLKEQSSNIALQNSKESRAQVQQIFKEKQFLKTIILIACIAFVCTMPSLVVFQIYDPLASKTDNFAREIFQETFLCFFLINFAVNPFIYVIRLRNYRKTLFIVYCRRGRSRS